MKHVQEALEVGAASGEEDRQTAIPLPLDCPISSIVVM